jgi:hypothetical protein
VIALGQLLEQERRGFDRVVLAEHAAAAPKRRADGIDDDYFTHGTSFLPATWMLSTPSSVRKRVRLL